MLKLNDHLKAHRRTIVAAAAVLALAAGSGGGYLAGRGNGYAAGEWAGIDRGYPEGVDTGVEIAALCVADPTRDESRCGGFRRTVAHDQLDMELMKIRDAAHDAAVLAWSSPTQP